MALEGLLRGLGLANRGPAAAWIIPSDDVLARTVRLKKPGTRQPHGVLEWHAMLRALEAEGAQSGLSACAR